MNLLKIARAEWLSALTRFRLDPNLLKIKKDLKTFFHSFFKIKDKVYAADTGKWLGEGGQGFVKVAEDYEGKDFALKVEPDEINEYDHEELRITEKINFSHGMMQRSLGGLKLFSKKSKHNSKTLTEYKKYKIYELLEGEDLFDLIHSKTVLTDAQKYIIAIKICQCIQDLHNQGIIHADIKPNNIKVNMVNNQIVVRIMDYGLSMELSPGETSISPNMIFGTKAYESPEIRSANPTYSFASDIYAMGIMFKEDLKLPVNVYDNMLSKPQSRPGLDVTIKTLVGLLEKCPNLDTDAKKVIDEVKPKVATAQQAAVIADKIDEPKKPIKREPINPQILKLQQLLQEKQKQPEPEIKGPQRLVSVRPKDVLFQQRQLEIRPQPAAVAAQRQPFAKAPKQAPLRQVAQNREGDVSQLPKLKQFNNGKPGKTSEFQHELNMALIKNQDKRVGPVVMK